MPLARMLPISLHVGMGHYVVEGRVHLGAHKAWQVWSQSVHQVIYVALGEEAGRARLAPRRPPARQQAGQAARQAGRQAGNLVGR